MADNVIRGEFPGEREARLRRTGDLFDALLVWLDDRDDARLKAATRRPAGELCPFRQAQREDCP